MPKAKTDQRIPIKGFYINTELGVIEEREFDPTWLDDFFYNTQTEISRSKTTVLDAVMLHQVAYDEIPNFGFRIECWDGSVGNIFGPAIIVGLSGPRRTHTYSRLVPCGLTLSEVKAISRFFPVKDKVANPASTFEENELASQETDDSEIKSMGRNFMIRPLELDATLDLASKGFDVGRVQKSWKAFRGNGLPDDADFVEMTNAYRLYMLLHAIFKPEIEVTIMNQHYRMRDIEQARGLDEK